MVPRTRGRTFRVSVTGGQGRLCECWALSAVEGEGVRWTDRGVLVQKVSKKVGASKDYKTHLENTVNGMLGIRAKWNKVEQPGLLS